MKIAYLSLAVLLLASWIHADLSSERDESNDIQKKQFIRLGKLKCLCFEDKPRGKGVAPLKLTKQLITGRRVKLPKYGDVLVLKKSPLRKAGGKSRPKVALQAKLKLSPRVLCLQVDRPRKPTIRRNVFVGKSAKIPSLGRVILLKKVPVSRRVHSKIARKIKVAGRKIRLGGRKIRIGGRKIRITGVRQIKVGGRKIRIPGGKLRIIGARKIKIGGGRIRIIGGRQIRFAGRKIRIGGRGIRIVGGRRIRVGGRVIRIGGRKIRVLGGGIIRRRYAKGLIMPKLTILKKTPKRRLIKIRRHVRARKFQKKQQQRFKLYIKTSLARVQLFQKKFLPKAKWFTKTYKRVLTTATRHNKAIVRIAAKAIKKRGIKWYRKFAQKKVQKVNTIIRKKLQLIQKIIMRVTVALLRQKHRVSKKVLQRKIQARVRQLLISYNRMVRRLKRQTAIFVKRGWKLSARIRGAIQLTKRSIKFSVKKLKAAKKTVPANKWMSRQLKKFGRVLRIVTRRARIFYKNNKVVGKWLLRKVKNDAAKAWVQGCICLEVLRQQHIKLGARKFKVIYKQVVKSKLRTFTRRLKKVVRKRIQQARVVIEHGGQSEYTQKIIRITYCSVHFVKVRRTLSSQIFRRQERAKFSVFVLRLHKSAQKFFKKQKKAVRPAIKLYRKVLKAVYRTFVLNLRTVAKSIKRHGYKFFVKYVRRNYRQLVKITKRKTTSLSRAVRIKCGRILGRKRGKVSKATKKRLALIIKKLIRVRTREIRVLRRKVTVYTRLGWILHKAVKLQEKKQRKLLRKAGIKLPKLTLKQKLRRIAVARKWRRIQNRKLVVAINKRLRVIKRFQRKLNIRGKWLIRSCRRVFTAAKRQHTKVAQIGFQVIKKRGLKWYKKFALKKVQRVNKVLNKKLNRIQLIILRKTAALLKQRSKVSVRVIQRKVRILVRRLLVLYQRISRKLQGKLARFVKKDRRILIGVPKRFKVIRIPKLKLTPRVSKKFLTKFSVKKCKCSKKIVSANKWMAIQLKKLGSVRKALKVQARIFYKTNKRVGKWYLRKVSDVIAKKFIEGVAFLNKCRRRILVLGAKKFKVQFKKVVKTKLTLLVKQMTRRVVKCTREAKLVLRLRKIGGSSARIARITSYKQRFVKIARRISAKVYRRQQTAKFGSFIARVTRSTKAFFKTQKKNVRFGYRYARLVISRCYGSFIGVLHAWYTGIARFGYGWYATYGRKKFTHFVKVLKKKTQTAVKRVAIKSQRILGSKVGRLTLALKRRFVRQVTVIAKSTTRAAKSFYKKHATFIQVGWKVRKAVKLAKIQLKIKMQKKLKLRVRKVKIGGRKVRITGVRQIKIGGRKIRILGGKIHLIGARKIRIGARRIRITGGRQIRFGGRKIRIYGRGIRIVGGRGIRVGRRAIRIGGRKIRVLGGGIIRRRYATGDFTPKRLRISGKAAVKRAKLLRMNLRTKSGERVECSCRRIRY